MYSVLIVDDNKPDREGIKNIIDWDSLQISSINQAVNGMEGYRKAMELKPDFIITDISMPVMNGVDMARKVYEALPNTKIIFVSCFDDFKYAKSAIDISVAAYILKPIKVEELENALKKVVSERQSRLNHERYQQQLKSQLQESLPLLQEKFIVDLLHGMIKDQEEIVKRGDYLKIDFKKYFSVVTLLIDDFDSKFADVDVEQKYMVTYELKKIVEDEILDKIGGFIIIRDYSNLTLVLFLDSGSSEEALSLLVETLTRCKDLINATLGIQVSMGIGGVSSRLIEASQMYQGADYATKSKFYSKGNRIFLSSEVVDLECSMNYNLQELKSQLELIIESGGKDDIISFISRYYDKTKHYSEGQVKGFCFSVINILQLILLEKNESFKSIFDDELVVWEKLSKFETIVDIEQWMINILSMVKSFLETRDNNRFKKLVEDIKAVVDANYSTIENINQVVDRFYICAGYANQIFKQYTGETIFDYLIKKRIEVAKRLLVETNDKIYEVAEKVGYSSKTYFTSIFKEYVGVLPKDYRNKNVKL